MTKSYCIIIYDVMCVLSLMEEHNEIVIFVMKI